MNDNVKKLGVIPATIRNDSDATGIFSQIKKSINDEDLLGIDPEAWIDEIDLEHAQSDERYLGALTTIEREMYIVQLLLTDAARSILIEFEAANSERVAAVMREKRIGPDQAAHYVMEENSNKGFITDADRIYMNKCGSYAAVCSSLYTYSVRERFNEYSAHIIVRAGFILYSFEHP